MSGSLLAVATALAILAQTPPGRVSVIVASPPAATPRDQLVAAPHLGIDAVEILANGAASGRDVPFGFQDTAGNLDALQAVGIENALVTVTPHVRTVPWLPETDETGREWSDRQNIFDSAFLSEWTRIHREFGAAFTQDQRIRRIYVAPPSYFGETEYYMGDNWATPRWLCYGPLARARFAVWLQARYGTPEAVAAAWRTQGTRFEDFAPPVARTDPQPSRHLETPWLDLMAWRTQYLNDRLEDQIRALADTWPREIGFKFSVGEFDAHQGSHAADLARRCADLPNMVLHMTNGHSISDLKYCAGLVRSYGAAAWVTENDGNRYSRTELARIALTALLSGVDEFNFAHHVHLLNLGGMPTDNGYALGRVTDLLAQHRPSPPRHEVAFLHSHTTNWVRAPHYTNRDVSQAYDAALANGARDDVRLFNWARVLAYPDVIGEPQAIDGDLAGRRMAVIPNTDITVLSRRAAAALLDWVASGGTLVCFGNDGMGWYLGEPGATPRLERDPRWDLPQVDVTASVAMRPTAAGESLLDTTRAGSIALPYWASALPGQWAPLLSDDAGRVGAAVLAIGTGSVIQFAGPVPTEPDPAYGEGVPALLRALAERLGVPFALRVQEDDGQPAHRGPALGYAGIDAMTGRHLFVGGPHDGSPGALRLTTGPGIAGPSELLLIDVRSADVAALRSEARVEIDAPPSLDALYADPTNRENSDRQQIPVFRVRFDAPAELLLTLAP